MNVYFRIWWLALTLIFLVEVITASVFRLKLDSTAVPLLLVILLPIVSRLIQAIKKFKGFEGSLPRHSALARIPSIKKFKGFETKRVRLAFGRASYARAAVFFVWIAFGYLLGFNLVQGWVWAYFGGTAIFILDSRISFLIALLFLVFCPLLVLMGKPAMSESMAVFVFYFLCIGTVSELLEPTYVKFARYGGKQ